MKWLLYGGRGWIGGQVVALLEQDHQSVVHGEARVDDEQLVEKELLEQLPDRIICLTGRTSGPGFPTVDYLEQKGKLKENVRDNLYGPVVLAILAQRHNIHLTYVGTGCIFTGYSDRGFDESAEANFFGSSYSVVKGYADRLMHLFPDTVLNVRVRMPVVNGPHPRSFLTKIMNYKKICSMPNSISVLPELLPVMLDLATKQHTGTINLVNPGLISHNEILEMVREEVDPAHTWENFSVEEQNSVLAAERSNTRLSSDKLLHLYPHIREVHVAIRAILKEYK